MFLFHITHSMTLKLDLREFRSKTPSRCKGTSPDFQLVESYVVDSAEDTPWYILAYPYPDRMPTSRSSLLRRQRRQMKKDREKLQATITRMKGEQKSRTRKGDKKLSQGKKAKSSGVNELTKEMKRVTLISN